MRTTGATTWFHAAPVPPLVAALGASHAVRVPRDEGSPAAAEPCHLALPPRLEGAVEARVRSYLAGRHCAVHALAALGRRPLPPAVGSYGAPVWPDGIVGSITHSPALAIAVVAPAEAYRGLGIDCERIMSATAAEEIGGRVLPEADRVSRRGDPAARLPWPVFMTAVFSAKESIYKCLNPLTGLFFEFDAVALEWIDLAAGNMGFRVQQHLGPCAPPGTLLTAQFCVDAEHVVTAVTLSAGDAAPHPFVHQASPPA